MVIKQRKVAPILKELNRFYVDSDHTCRGPYFVDLAELGGNGQCDCDDFRFKVKAYEIPDLIEKGYWNRCKHIVAAVNLKALIAVRHDENKKL